MGESSSTNNLNIKLPKGGNLHSVVNNNWNIKLPKGGNLHSVVNNNWNIKLPKTPIAKGGNK